MTVFKIPPLNNLTEAIGRAMRCKEYTNLIDLLECSFPDDSNQFFKTDDDKIAGWIISYIERKNWQEKEYKPFDISSIQYGCRNSVHCPKCDYDIVCNTNKAGTEDTEKKEYYISGPCACGMQRCSRCGHEFFSRTEFYK